VLPAQIGHRLARLSLLQDRQDLAVRKSLSLNVELLQHRKFYFSDPQLDGGITLPSFLPSEQ
jgi:hypothetical protein